MWLVASVLDSAVFRIYLYICAIKMKSFLEELKLMNILK